MESSSNRLIPEDFGQPEADISTQKSSIFGALSGEYLQDANM